MSKQPDPTDSRPVSVPATTRLSEAERTELARQRAAAAEAWRAYVESGALLHRLRSEFLERQFLLAMQRERRAGEEIWRLNWLNGDWAQRHEVLNQHHARLRLQHAELHQQHAELQQQRDELDQQRAALEQELDRLARLGLFEGIAHACLQRLRRSRLAPLLRAVKHRLVPPAAGTEPAPGPEVEPVLQVEPVLPEAEAARTTEPEQTPTSEPTTTSEPTALPEPTTDSPVPDVADVPEIPASDAPAPAEAEPPRPAARFEPGGRAAYPSLKTVLLLTVHADDTPLSRYTLDVIDALAAHRNVLVWHLDEGPLLPEFKAAATGFLADSEPRFDYALARRVVFEILDAHPEIEFALVTGGELKCPLPALGERHVPVIGLVDESVVTASSLYAFEEILFWHTHTLFTHSTTAALLQRAYPYVNAKALSVSVPGPGARSLPRFTDQPPDNARLPLALRHDPAAPIDALIVGWGPVSYDSGVDLFVACADAVLRSAAGKRYRFAWLAQAGPVTDEPTRYGLSVHAQLEALGLQEQVSLLYEPLSEALFAPQVALVLDTARSDRLQHNPVRALQEGIPVLAFAGLTDVARAMQGHGLSAPCLARAGNVPELADKALALLADHAQRHNLGQRVKAINWQALTLDGHIATILDTAAAQQPLVQQESADEAAIRESGQLRPDYIGYVVDHADELECDIARLYVRGWQAGIGSRKPRPGFQPQIYAQAAMPADSREDPFAHYLRAGAPQGPWDYPVIRPMSGEADADSQARYAAQQRTALHIHAYYPEMLEELLARLSLNRARPDLFVSVKDEACKARAAALLQAYPGKLVALEIVPNRGRDIGPFLTTFGPALVRDYELIGHLHTKGSHHADRLVVERWRHFLLETLLGGEQAGNMMDSILAQMGLHPDWGIAFPDDPIPLGWDGNRDDAQTLATQLMPGPLPDHFCFPAGTMFWIRAEALRPFVELGLSYDDYPAEPLPVDGTLLHALERLFGIVPRARGLQSALTTVPGVSR